MENPTTIDLGQQLPVMEAFYTIQGEGYHQGKAAYFIRLGGCDVGCHWCDVKDSWDASKWPLQTVEHIVDQACQYPGRLAVITGGEPLMHNLYSLTVALQNKGFKTNIETSGAYERSGLWDWVCLSPKKFKEPLPEILPFVDELKAIIYNKSDMEFAEKYSTLIKSAGNTRAVKRYLQPEWSKSQEMNSYIVEYVKNNPQWQIGLQTHKFLDIP